MIKALTGTLALLIVLCTGSVVAEQNSQGRLLSREGNGKGAAPCVSCHGEQGNGNAAANYPYLAGLSAPYIERQLRGFQNGARLNPLMQPMAKALSDPEIKALAAYYAGLSPAPLPAPKEPTAEDLHQGRDIANQGRWQAGVPACFKCHGDAGQGIPPDFPPLSGQPAGYLQQQLDAWAQGKRLGDPIQLMQAVAVGLSQSEREAVARYLASLPAKSATQASKRNKQ